MKTFYGEYQDFMLSPFSYATRLDGRERETALHCAIRWEKQSVVDMFNGKDSGEVFKGEVCKQRRNQAHIVRCGGEILEIHAFQCGTSMIQ